MPKTNDEKYPFRTDGRTDYKKNALLSIAKHKSHLRLDSIFLFFIVILF